MRLFVLKFVIYYQLEIVRELDGTKVAVVDDLDFEDDCLLLNV